MLVRTIQTYQKSMPVADAVEKAVSECSKEGVLADFLKSHRSEVLRMYLAETDEQRIMFSLYKEGHIEGLREGFQEGHIEGRTEGLTEGLAKGHTELLSSQIIKKLAKGKSLEQIAEELEDDVENIRPIYEQLVREQR